MGDDNNKMHYIGASSFDRADALVLWRNFRSRLSSAKSFYWAPRVLGYCGCHGTRKNEQNEPVTSDNDAH